MLATPILPAPIFVPYEAELQRGTLLDRRDRFIANVRLPAGDVEAHCVNPGRMEAFVDAGASVWLLPAPDTAAGRARKLRYTWEAIERRDERAGDGRPIMCGANTQRPNALVRAALESRCLAGLEAWTHLKPEPKFEVCTSDGSGAVHSGRADFKLTTCSGGGGGSRSGATGMATEHEHYVEVKNCHLVYEDGWAYFPDSVSERAARHCDALAALVSAGHRCSVIFVVQRDDVVHGVRPSAFHDPTFAAAAARAAAAGVDFRALRAVVSESGTHLTHEVPVDLTGALDETVIRRVRRISIFGERPPRALHASAQYSAVPSPHFFHLGRPPRALHASAQCGAVPSSPQVRGWCEANRPTTGWTRSATGRRVANGPFAHAAKGAVLGAAPRGGTAGAPSMQAPTTAPRGGARQRPAPIASEPGRPRRAPSVGAAPGAASSSGVTGPCSTGPATGDVPVETLSPVTEMVEVRARGSRKTKAKTKVDVHEGTL